MNPNQFNARGQLNNFVTDTKFSWSLTCASYTAFHCCKVTTGVHMEYEHRKD